jgi:hypothetical protein
VAHISPMNTAGIERHWHPHRWHPRSQRAHNDNRDAGGGLCPLCKGFASIGPRVAEYRGNGLVQRHWQCRACGHDWTTALHVLA